MRALREEKRLAHIEEEIEEESEDIYTRLKRIEKRLQEIDL
jgi:hypothetical protein